MFVVVVHTYDRIKVYGIPCWFNRTCWITRRPVPNAPMDSKNIEWNCNQEVYMSLELLEKTSRSVENKIGLKAKRELIRSIQEKKGKIPCFQTGKQYCDQYDCSWRRDCLP